MSKINIKTSLKSSNYTHTFNGKGIKNKNIIIYNDNNINTKIIVGDPLEIIRTDRHILKLGFSKGRNIKGTYDTPEGVLETKTNVEKLEIKENQIKIKYQLYINDSFIDTFEFNFKYSIDTESNNR